MHPLSSAFYILRLQFFPRNSLQFWKMSRFKKVVRHYFIRGNGIFSRNKKRDNRGATRHFTFYFFEKARGKLRKEPLRYQINPRSPHFGAQEYKKFFAISSMRTRHSASPVSLWEDTVHQIACSPFILQFH